MIDTSRSVIPNNLIDVTGDNVTLAIEMESRCGFAVKGTM